MYVIRRERVKIRILLLQLYIEKEELTQFALGEDAYRPERVNVQQNVMNQKTIKTA